MCGGTYSCFWPKLSLSGMYPWFPKYLGKWLSLKKWVNKQEYDVLQASFMKLKVLKTCHKISTEFHSNSKEVVWKLHMNIQVYKACISPDKF